MSAITAQHPQPENCSICWEPITENKAHLVCNHIFHNQCIERWKGQTDSCPLCRFSIIKIDLNDPYTQELKKIIHSLEKVDQAISVWIKDNIDIAFALNLIKRCKFELQVHLEDLYISDVFNIDPSHTNFKIKQLLLDLPVLANLNTPIGNLMRRVNIFGVDHYFNPHKIILYNAITEYLDTSRILLEHLKSNSIEVVE